MVIKVEAINNIVDKLFKDIKVRRNIEIIRLVIPDKTVFIPDTV